MNREVKDLWVTALRSGKYVQGHTGLLEHGNGKESVYCPFGVLCSVAADAGICTRTVDENGRVSYVDSSGDPQDEILPADVASWAGLDSKSELILTYRGDREPLSYLNDKQMVPFVWIAALINEQL